jgi:hypothetical protein
MKSTFSKIGTKIALVALASTGLTLISSNVANAALFGTPATSITVATPTATTAVGTAASSTFSLVGAVGAASTTTKITVANTNPYSSTAVATLSSTGLDTGTAAIGTPAISETITASASGVSATFVAGTVSVTPDRPGTYVVTLTNLSVTATFTVTATQPVNATVVAPRFANVNMYDATNGYQVVNGEATVDIGVDTTTSTLVSITGVGSIVSATPAQTGYETLTSVTSTGFKINSNGNNPGGIETVTVVLCFVFNGFWRN